MPQVTSGGDNNHGAGSTEAAIGGVSRRGVLRATSATVVGATCLTAASGSVQAGEIKDCANIVTDAPANFPRVDVSRSDPVETNVPHGVREICLFAHGWNGMKRSDGQARTLEVALRRNGYTEPVVAVRWNADTLNFWRAESRADTAGARLANWIRGYRAANPHTTIRLVGHSLGSRVSLATLDALDGDEVVDTVALLGAAVQDRRVCSRRRHGDGIRRSAGTVFNYHSRNDDVICIIFNLQTFAGGLGCSGERCGRLFRGPAPANYHDVDVSSQVGGHCEFFLPEEGMVPRIVADFGG